jgi:hypothetical protein
MSIVVDQAADQPVKDSSTELLSWINTRVDSWRQFRDNSHKDRWDEYFRIWRGIFDPADKSRKSERAKLISPATMQAVDTTVAEIEEAVFGREQWFDLAEDVSEEDDADEVAEMLATRDLLLERMEKANVPDEMAKAFLIGAVYGTGVAKIITNVTTEDAPDGGKKEVVVIELNALEPYEFIPDPTTERIDRMLGMAHETIVPLHEVKQLIRDKIYRDVEIGPYTGSQLTQNDQNTESDAPKEDSVFIREYHGLVPASKLLAYLPGGPKEADAQLAEGEDDLLVEAIVTIGNENICLRAIKNPHNGDRDFISYQHDTVPNYFWGRGVVEKAYHPQKALDATTRARIDALGLVAHPMIAGDVTRLPRGMNMGVWPGKFWPTTGNPSETITGFRLGDVDPNLFSNAQDMERQVQTATGAMDPGAAYNPGQAGGATNTALSASMFIKRARRTMQNIERNFIQPMITKIYTRYARFDQENFPADLNFKPKGTLGIMAREFEQQQMIQMLALVPNESQPFFAMMKAIFDQGSSPHKASLTKAVDEWTNPEQTPEEKQQAAEQQALQQRMLVAQVEEVEAKAQKAKAEAARAMGQANESQANVEYMGEEMHQKHIENAINLREVEAFESQNELAMMTQHLRAIDLAIKAMVAQANVKKLEADATNFQNS